MMSLHPYTLQLAVLTAAAVGTRCFPGSIRALISPALAAAPLRVWPWLGLTFGHAVTRILGPDFLSWLPGPPVSRVLLFGNALDTMGAVRITFDGWIAKVGPVERVSRLAERQYFSAAGVLAASLAMSELFLLVCRHRP